jgi:hypothetical protein
MTMAPGNYDFEIAGGDCLPLRFNIKDGDGNPVNLEGYVAASFEWEWADGSGVVDLTPVNSPAVDGELDGELTKEQTAALPEGRLTTYKLRIIQPSGCPRTLLTGYITRI